MGSACASKKIRVMSRIGGYGSMFMGFLAITLPISRFIYVASIVAAVPLLLWLGSCPQVTLPERRGIVLLCLIFLLSGVIPVLRRD